MPEPFPYNNRDPWSVIDPMPARTPPRFDSRWINGLCELGPRPLVTTGWLRLWLTHHFGDASLIEGQEPSLQKSLWTRDTKTTNIAIESVTRWVPELTEHRPGIIIKRNGWKRVRQGIADRLMFTWPIDGQQSFTNFWQGSHTLFCITPGGDGAECELLAAEVYRELNQFGPIVREILNLVRFEVTEVGELLLLEQARENFVVPVTVSYAYQEGWRLLQEAPKIRRIDLATFYP
jgi:hypothetical protein